MALGAPRRQMEEPLSVRRELPGGALQQTRCKKGLLIMKVQIRTALKMASAESLNRSRAVTLRLGQDGGFFVSTPTLLVNLQSERGSGHPEFT